MGLDYEVGRLHTQGRQAEGRGGRAGLGGRVGVGIQCDKLACKPRTRGGSCCLSARRAPE